MECSTYPNELTHWGIKGQKWGQRRYQNKDGSLTPAGQKRYNKEVAKLKEETAKVKAAEKAAATRKKTQSKLDKLEAKKQDLEARKKALKEGKDPEEEAKKAAETAEAKKARLLDSVDAKELYENKELFTTQELNERINRIDTEARLQGKIVEEHKKTGMDYMDGAKTTLDKAVSMYKSIDNAYSTVTNSAIGKTIAKQLGLEPPKKKFDLGEFVKNIEYESPQRIAEVNKMLTNQNSIIQEHNKRENKKKADADFKKQEKEAQKQAEKEAKDAEARKKEAQKQVDEYNERYKRGESDDSVKSTQYGKSGEDLTDARTDTRYGNVKDYPAVIDERSVSTGLSVVNSKSTNSWANNTRVDDVEVIEPDWVEKMKRNGLM